MAASALALHLFIYWIKVNSQTVCHTTTVVLMLAVAGAESFGTNILYHLAYIMYRCYHLKSEISKKRSQFLFRRYTGYAAFTLVLLFFVYNWGLEMLNTQSWQVVTVVFEILLTAHQYFSSSLPLLTNFFKSRCSQLILSITTSSI